MSNWISAGVAAIALIISLVTIVSQDAIDNTNLKNEIKIIKQTVENLQVVSQLLKQKISINDEKIGRILRSDNISSLMLVRGNECPDGWMLIRTRGIIAPITNEGATKGSALILCRQ